MTIHSPALSTPRSQRAGGSLGRSGSWGPRIVVGLASPIERDRPPELLALLLGQHDTVDISPEGLALSASAGQAVVWHDVPERFYTPAGAMAVSVLTLPPRSTSALVAADRADRVEISDAARHLLAGGHVPSGELSRRAD